MNLMTNPQAVLAPYQTAARNQVNDNYTGLADTLRQQFLSTGGGTSGKYGMALANANVGRLGQLSNVDNQFAQEAASLPITAGAPLAEQLLGMNFGSTTSSSNSSSGTQTSQTSQGNPASTGLGTFAKILGAML